MAFGVEAVAALATAGDDDLAADVAGAEDEDGGGLAGGLGQGFSAVATVAAFVGAAAGLAAALARGGRRRRLCALLKL